MRVVIQRVSQASVTVENEIISEIKTGLLVLLGVGEGDTKDIVTRYMDKIFKLRIFSDSNGKTNLSLSDVQGEILLVSQFTLYASCKKGNRPDFIQAGNAALAKELYEYALAYTKDKLGKVEAGIFGADMKIALVNDGPFTLILDEDLMG